LLILPLFSAIASGVSGIRVLDGAIEFLEEKWIVKLVKVVI